MKNEGKKNKIKTILSIAIISLVAAFILVCFIVQMAAPQTAFSAWLAKNVWNVSDVTTKLKAHLPVLIRCTIYIVIVYAACKVVRMIFKWRIEKSNRAKTVLSLIDGVVKYGGAVAIILIFLKACGVNTTALVASVGVLTLIVGLGAQPLIADIIAGIFIVFEDEYSVGEIVCINDFRGTVLEIGIRSTKIQDAAGNIKIINNSSIGDVINLSRDLSLAVVDCDFPYTIPLERVEYLLSENLEKIKEKIPAIVEGPYYKGVCQYKDSNVTLKIFARCHEEDRFQVERDLLREYRILLVENEIDIAFPQVVINYPSETQEKQEKPTKKERRVSAQFNKEQKDLSEGLEEQQL